jgi:hypothetical protein
LPFDCFVPPEPSRRRRLFAIQIAETRPATFVQAVGNASARTIYPIGHREEDL